MDWPIACVVIAYGAACWLAGWHSSIRASGRMYDDGFKAGYSAGVTAIKDEGFKAGYTAVMVETRGESR